MRSRFASSDYYKALMFGPLARLNLHSINTGKHMTGDFLNFLYQLAYKEGYRNFEVAPDEILELAEKKWDWGKFT